MPHLTDYSKQIMIPIKLLPEAKNWLIDKTYEVRLNLKQKAVSDEYATFEIVDAFSLESEKESRYVPSDTGTLKAA